MNIIKIVLYDFEPLLYIFNQIIHTSNIVNQMKIAIIIPIYIKMENMKTYITIFK